MYSWINSLLLIARVPNLSKFNELTVPATLRFPSCSVNMLGFQLVRFEHFPDLDRTGLSFDTDLAVASAPLAWGIRQSPSRRKVTRVGRMGQHRPQSVPGAKPLSLCRTLQDPTTTICIICMNSESNLSTWDLGLEKLHWLEHLEPHAAAAVVSGSMSARHNVLQIVAMYR
jgi:hypothetical protein